MKSTPLELELFESEPIQFVHFLNDSIQKHDSNSIKSKAFKFLESICYNEKIIRFVFNYCLDVFGGVIFKLSNEFQLENTSHQILFRNAKETEAALLHLYSKGFNDNDILDMAIQVITSISCVIGEHSIELIDRLRAFMNLINGHLLRIKNEFLLTKVLALYSYTIQDVFIMNDEPTGNFYTSLQFIFDCFLKENKHLTLNMVALDEFYNIAFEEDLAEYSRDIVVRNFPFLIQFVTSIRSENFNLIPKYFSTIKNFFYTLNNFEAELDSEAKSAHQQQLFGRIPSTGMISMGNGNGIDFNLKTSCAAQVLVNFFWSKFCAAINYGLSISKKINILDPDVKYDSDSISILLSIQMQSIEADLRKDIYYRILEDTLINNVEKVSVLTCENDIYKLVLKIVQDTSIAMHPYLDFKSYFELAYSNCTYVKTYHFETIFACLKRNFNLRVMYKDFLLNFIAENLMKKDIQIFESNKIMQQTHCIIAELLVSYILCFWDELEVESISKIYLLISNRTKQLLLSNDELINLLALVFQLLFLLLDQTNRLHILSSITFYEELLNKNMVNTPDFICSIKTSVSAQFYSKQISFLVYRLSNVSIFVDTNLNTALVQEDSNYKIIMLLIQYNILKIKKIKRLITSKCKKIKIFEEFLKSEPIITKSRLFQEERNEITKSKEIEKEKNRIVGPGRYNKVIAMRDQINNEDCNMDDGSQSESFCEEDDEMDEEESSFNLFDNSNFHSPAKNVKVNYFNFCNPNFKQLIIGTEETTLFTKVIKLISDRTPNLYISICKAIPDLSRLPNTNNSECVKVEINNTVKLRKIVKLKKHK